MNTISCTKCEKEYPLTSKYFNKGSGTSGLREVCKQCQKEYNQKYRSINNDKIKEYNKNFRENNKDKLKIRDKKYYQKNNEKIKNRSQKWHQNNKEKNKEYYKNNKEEISKKHKKWLQNNKEKVRECAKKYNEEHKEEIKKYHQKRHEENKEKERARSRKYYHEHKKEIRAYINNKRKTDPGYRIRLNLNRRIRCALKSQKIIKSNKTMKLVGCGIDFLKKHLESKFENGMTWDNYGVNGWHMDHIKPCAAFDLTLDEQQKECFHYTNIQPLWAKDNVRKHSYYNGITVRRTK